MTPLGSVEFFDGGKVSVEISENPGKACFYAVQSSYPPDAVWSRVLWVNKLLFAGLEGSVQASSEERELVDRAVKAMDFLGMHPIVTEIEGGKP